MHPSLILMLFALGCSGDDKSPVDSDGDGLMDDDESKWGSDPDNPDTDGDGLSDGDEVDASTDPTIQDTDGDTYWDGWEAIEGTDPTDPESRIYTGYWPYQVDKDVLLDSGNLVEGDWGSRAQQGDPLPRLQWVDQYGETVDIYDYAMQGKPIVIDVSGAWCSYCQEMAKWLDGRSNWFSQNASTYGWGDWIDLVPELVDNGDIYWVTAIDSDNSGAAADADDVVAWFEHYPNDKIAVLLDQDQQFADWLRITGYPTVFMVEEDLTVAVLNRNDYTAVFDELASRYGE